MAGLDKRVGAIEERNVRVTYDKAWETSWTRRSFVAVITYVAAIILLKFLGHEGAYKHALVPVMGYLLSTLSLEAVKKIWIKHAVAKDEGLKNVTIH